METYLGTLSFVPCGRRDESCDGNVLDIDECCGEWLEEDVVCKETMNRTTMDKSAETLLLLLDIALFQLYKKIDFQA